MSNRLHLIVYTDGYALSDVLHDFKKFLDVVKNLKLLGISTQDEALKMMGNTTKSSFTKCSEEECLQLCQRIAPTARTLLPSLQEHGFEVEVLNELDATSAIRCHQARTAKQSARKIGFNHRTRGQIHRSRRFVRSHDFGGCQSETQKR